MVMNIKIKVINALTNQVEIDGQIEVTSDYETVKKNYEVFRRAYPDCQVNFFMDEMNWMCYPAYNMIQDEIAYDEGRMTWNEYVTKWYKGCPSLCNEELEFA
jgi:hypothetical protein